MRILNIHSRIIAQPKNELEILFSSLSSKNDKIWPKNHWPRLKFKDGLKVGAKGGHGPIRYTIEIFNPEEKIQFRFDKPQGFNGVHRFEIIELDSQNSFLKHSIDMKSNLRATLIWYIAIKWLHDALIEDLLDRVENHYNNSKKRTKWSLWVKFLRKILG